MIRIAFVLAILASAIVASRNPAIQVDNPRNGPPFVMPSTR